MRCRSLAVLLLAACTQPPAAPPPFEPAILTDVDPDPAVVEVELVAGLSTHEYLPGRPAEVWAFRDGAQPGAVGTVPGPMIDARVGDRLVVRFRNELPEETTIHWHGLRVPNASDGTPTVQVPVPPGGTYVYETTLTDAGLFWYHPHVRGDVQVERGLYAPIRVRADDGIDVAADRVMVLDDVKLEASGSLSERTDTLDLMLGRQGNVVVVNGRRRATVEVASGSRERWRFVNAANGRYFRLELPGQALRVIGWDGGLVEEPYEVDRLLIAPGERYDVLVELDGAPGSSLTLRTVHYDRGHEIPDPGPIDLVTLAVTAARAAPAALPSTWGTIAEIPIDAATPRRRFALREDDSIPAEPIFTINGEAFPAITPIAVTRGAVEIWDVENTMEMDHPFHLHGMFFVVLGADGAPIAPLGWKDTVNVPRGTTVSLAVRIEPLGRWMFHCHVLEHAERGMMGELSVAAP